MLKRGPKRTGTGRRTRDVKILVILTEREALGALEPALAALHAAEADSGLVARGAYTPRSRFVAELVLVALSRPEVLAATTEAILRLRRDHAAGICALPESTYQD